MNWPKSLARWIAGQMKWERADEMKGTTKWGWSYNVKYYGIHCISKCSFFLVIVVVVARLVYSSSRHKVWPAGTITQSSRQFNATSANSSARMPLHTPRLHSLTHKRLHLYKCTVCRSIWDAVAQITLAQRRFLTTAAYLEQNEQMNVRAFRRSSARASNGEPSVQKKKK